MLHLPAGRRKRKGRAHLRILMREDTAQHQQTARRHRIDELRHETHQHIGLDIRQHNFGLRARRQTGDEIGGRKSHRAREIVERGVFFGNAHSLGIVVKTRHLAPAQPDGRQREDARAAAGIDHATSRAMRLGTSDEALDAETGRLVVAGAKRQAGIKPDGGLAGTEHMRGAFPDRHPMQTAAAPGFEVGLVAIAPILIAQRALDRRAGCGLGGQEREQLGPADAGLLGGGKDADDPRAVDDDVLKQAPALDADFLHELIHGINRGGSDFNFQFKEVHKGRSKPRMARMCADKTV